MTKGQFAFVIVLGLLLAVAVALLIWASVEGLSIPDLVKSWFPDTTETPVEEVVEESRLFLNLLKI